ncbi:MAG: phosphoribosylformylglycinamidine cyclo-ligase [Candidatus Thermoplasmatota archaeon]|nr:phosphoribosylformylglycinamidine cyclo-ligase [Candidatus Thermoplasmatota archaeon]
MTYAESGVDIFAEEKTVSSLIGALKTGRKGFGKPLNIKGHYAGLVDFGKYALTLCTDGVGSKVIIADEMKKWDTIGIDCIAMNVNDCICVGATPVAFVDCLAIESPNPKLAEQIGIGLNRGAKLSNMSLVGGETALLPELIHGFDLAGTCLGYVEKKNIITGKKIKPGDVIIGLRSSGIHSNGLTLARKIFENRFHERFPKSNKKIGEILLEPTRIYVKEILEVIKKFRVHGLAHITGRGVRKLLRLNKNVGYSIDNPFKPHPVFELIQETGNVDDKEMYQTFNMGMGFCIIASEKDADSIVDMLKGKARVVGSVVQGKEVKIPEMCITYKK